MATKSDKIKTIKEIHPRVELTDAELKDKTVEELDAIIESKNGVKPAKETDELNLKIPKDEATTSVHFVMADGRHREFNQEDHGDDFVAIANEFHETNRRYVQSRDDQ